MISDYELNNKQKELDKEKYLQSSKENQDLSGKMIYCRTCEYCYRPFTQCCLEQRSREVKFACAKAYFKGIENDTRKKSTK